MATSDSRSCQREEAPIALVYHFFDLSRRLLIAGLRWPPETFLARLLVGLLEDGMEILVTCPRRPSKEFLRHAGFGWLWSPSWTGIRLFRLLRLEILVLLALGRSPRALLRLWKAMQAQPASTRTLGRWSRILPLCGRRCEAIYMPWIEGAVTYLPVFELGTPVIVGCRGSQVNVAPHDPRRTWIKETYPRLFARSAAVHCVSKNILSEATLYGLDVSKARVIWPAVDPSFFEPAQASQSDDSAPLRLVTTGSLLWRKGYEYLLQSLALLAEFGTKAHLTIVGDGPDRDRIVFTVEDLGLGAMVELAGELDPAAVRLHLQQAEVFVLASLSEGLSNAVLEAMSCGLPVVTTACGGMPEAIEHGVEGYLVPVRNPQALATALGELAADRDRVAKMGRAARKRVQAQFSIRSQLRQFAAMVEEVQG